jgi:hypothetical protein
MARNRVATPTTTVLNLVDVARAAHRDLLEKGKALPDGTYRKATEAELDASFAKVKQAEEDGDWLIVKSELNAGETRRLYTGLVLQFNQGEPAKLDPEKVGLTKILAYLVGWSFKKDEKPIPYSLDLPEKVRMDTLFSLDPDSYAEVDAAVDAHELATEKARTDRKNAQDGAIASSAISPSVAG